MSALLPRGGARTVPVQGARMSRESVELFDGAGARTPSLGSKRRLLSKVGVDELGRILEAERLRRTVRRSDFEFVCARGAVRHGPNLAHQKVRIALQEPDHRVAVRGLDQQCGCQRKTLGNGGCLRPAAAAAWAGGVRVRKMLVAARRAG